MPSVPEVPRVTAVSLVDAYLIAAAAGAASLPALLAYNVPPSATFFNQAAALIGWGAVAVLTALSIVLRPRASASASTSTGSGVAGLATALMIVIAAAAASSIFGALPRSLSMSAIGMILAALVMLWAGACARQAGVARPVFVALCIGLVVAGTASAMIACIQVLAPSLVDGVLIARSEGGRASGNLRQSNHLSSLVVWASIAAVWLAEARLIKRGLAAALVILYVLTVVLSASRTGIMELVALTLWGALDRRLSRGMRLLLVLTPVIYVLCWLGLAEWAKAGSQVFAGTERLKQADVSSSRFAIWSNAIDMIKAQPWLGTGFGEFNLAWTLTPFPHRPTEFFDDPHNLVLHLATELGVPLGLVVTGLLCRALWQVFAASRDDPRRGDGHRLGSGTGSGTGSNNDSARDSSAYANADAHAHAHAHADLKTITRAAFMMIVAIGVHSQLEYPLWYAYFLLPTALMLGLGLGADPPADAPTSSAPTPLARAPAYALLAMGALVVLASMAALIDYDKVVVIFAPPNDAGPLMDRIEAGEKSWLFAHHAGYAMSTTEQEPPAELSAFKEPVHYLLDGRLMLAWAEAYARAGDVQRAAYIAQRFKEFQNGDDVSPYFDVCGPARSSPTPPSPSPSATVSGRNDKQRVTLTVPATTPFQCTTPTLALTWRDFR